MHVTCKSHGEFGRTRACLLRGQAFRDTGQAASLLELPMTKATVKSMDVLGGKLPKSERHAEFLL